MVKMTLRPSVERKEKRPPNYAGPVQVMAIKEVKEG
jgi:hypothetical protein